MATQPPAPRQWFRLPSIVRGPVRPAAAAPEPLAPQQRLPIVRALIRPQPEPTQTQESTPAPPPPAYDVTSAPTSPFRRTSLPFSPAPRTSPPPTILHDTTSSPKPQLSAPSSSLPTSPSLKPPASPPNPSNSSMPTSPPKTALTTFAAPTSPPKPSPSRFLVRTSPPKPAPTASYVPNSLPKPEPIVTINTRVPRPSPSPQTINPGGRTPPQSPFKKPTVPPASPLILPPAQIKSKAELEPTIPAETEQKTTLVQTISEKRKSWLNGTGNHKGSEETHKHSSYAHHGNHEVHKDVAKTETDHLKKFSSDSDEVGMRIITIAGDNKGAVMEVIKSPLKHSFDGNSHTLLKTESNGTGWKSFSSSSDEGKSKKDKNHKAKAMLSPPMGAFMNSNVQGINNSIAIHSSYSHHDPGVHLSLSRKPSGNGFHIKDKSNGHRS